MVLLGDRSKREANYAEHMTALVEKVAVLTNKIRKTELQLQAATQISIMGATSN